MQMFENQESEVQIKLCRNASILAKLVSILLTLALAIHIAAMSTSYWLVSYTENGKDLDIHTGIWVSCAKSEDIIWICDSFEQYPGFNAWFYVTQTFAVFGILVLIPNILISVLYTLLPKLSGRKFAAILTIVLSLCAGSFIVISIALYGKNIPLNSKSSNPGNRYHFYFGFWFEIIAAIICYLCSGLLFLELRKNIIV